MSPDRESKSERGFALYVATIALILAFAAIIAMALKNNSGGDSGSKPESASADSAKEAPPSSGATAGPEAVSLVIKTDEEHAKKGPEGTWHDAYLPADFTVHAGATVKVTVRNYDDSGHSFTSAGLGTNQMIKGGSAQAPSTTTFTFTAPAKKGSYEWHCMMPCDPWAMAHTGFMKGVVTVV